MNGLKKSDLYIWMGIEGSDDPIERACIVIVEKQPNADTAVSRLAKLVEQVATRPVAVPDVILRVDASGRCAH